MVKYCVLCDNRDKTASYHKFPQDVQIKTKWLKFCNLDEAILRTSTFLCSNHFTKEDYLLTATNKILKNKSIPSVYHIKRKKRSLDDNDKDCKHNKEIAKRKKSECLLNIHEEESCSTVIQHPTDNNISDEPTHEKESCSTIIQHTADNNISDEPTHEKELCSTIIQHPADNNIGNEPTHEESCSTIIQHPVDNNVNKTPENENLKNSREIHYGTDAVLPINVTPPNSPREARYIGDIRTPHLATTRRAKRALNIAKLVVKKQRRKILTLQQQTTRLKNRVKTMKDLIDHLKKKNFISENAVDHLMVYQEVSI
ncbi:THAP domain-containing protein 6-like [Solenopsis invicta]|uniref:THAP domain-containing protein 6-like n=1 Tax=Solenopsis invicta TaxID=13686 RepID=UPI00193DDC7B|nr:THAP domain-containing protein 6-like [Solenopsis invicta]